MILLLDTSTPLCKLTFIDGDWRYDDEWQANRELAKGLLGYLKGQLEKNSKDVRDVTGIGVFRGPGSFTGLRIGLTVLNTLADAEKIRIVGGEGDAWQKSVQERLNRGDNDKLILPLYGSAVHITQPRK